MASMQPLNDAAGRTRGERKRKIIASAPAYLKRRVERGEELPVVKVIDGRRGYEEEEVRAEVLKHVVMEGKLVKEILIDLWGI